MFGPTFVCFRSHLEGDEGETERLVCVNNPDDNDVITAKLGKTLSSTKVGSVSFCRFLHLSCVHSISNFLKPEPKSRTKKRMCAGAQPAGMIERRLRYPDVVCPNRT